MTTQSQESASENKAEVAEEQEKSAITGEVVEDMPQDEAAQQVPTPESDNPATLQAALDEARAKAEENWNNMMRLQAEMDNLRKRTTRDVEHAHKYALEKFVNELLPVIDSLELGISAAEDSSGDETASLREGMELTLKKFQDVMSKFGVDPIDPQGEKFNPELHEAVSMQESNEYESNTVMSVVQKGYTLNDRLVRAAMVVVAK